MAVRQKTIDEDRLLPRRFRFEAGDQRCLDFFETRNSNSESGKLTSG